MCESVVGELHAAAFLGDGLRVDQILAGHLHLLEATNEWGWTPLMQAAKGGHLGLVATLVSHGADVNAVNKLGMDVLSLASASGHRRIVLLLMEHGAKSGTAAISAAVHGHSEIFSQVSEVLEDQVLKISNSTILHLAVAVGAADIVHESVRRGANPNSRDEAGMTALDLAEQDADSASKREILTILRKVSDCTLSGEWSEGVVESSRVGDLGRLLVLLAEMSTKCMMRQDLHHTHDFSKALLAAAENGHALVTKYNYKNWKYNILWDNRHSAQTKSESECFWHKWNDTVDVGRVQRTRGGNGTAVGCRCGLQGEKLGHRPHRLRTGLPVRRDAARTDANLGQAHHSKRGGRDHPSHATPTPKVAPVAATLQTKLARSKIASQTILSSWLTNVPKVTLRAC
ncbi:fibronectin type 3 and ankyrin repeat domains 1 protein-like isoform X3 [Neocloeon triangulifer]|uniref:fibronectin type 3 and ankyrin repeat domains 1 protein-like isoform X2 n=1 Tax=Neocloeon triangulifer TaxID=2078957 RepID=UPI00286F52CD|nr:fibronectin type 3 and ankyrin repeat domains 1 protein-like isoform X2 [Neocloeon triangulifer]XP_059468436.1 fibronectin type 3 and ankyrin repeat domains 1 protein-like isoform X3 [Neocloeon triangulifer]